MDSLMKWGLILGGGYLVAKYFGIDPLAGLLHSTTTVATPASPGTTNTTADTASAQNTLNMIQHEMVASKQDPTAYYTSDVWGYYYNLVRGVPPPDHNTLFPNDPPSKMYSISEWWGAMTGQGFSGFGVIANRINPYANPKGTPYGSNIRPKASELFNVRFN